jgi:type VI secretion system protein
MFKERLLERISHMEGDPSYRPDAPDIEVELKSILKYVQNILSTKQGSAVIAYDFGIPDITNFHDKSYGEYIKDLETSLTKTIANYEPRLKSIKVIYDQQDGKTTVMHFKIKAQLSNYENIPIVFETVINPNGEVAIHE